MFRNTLQFMFGKAAADGDKNQQLPSVPRPDEDPDWSNTEEQRREIAEICSRITFSAIYKLGKLTIAC